MIVVNGDGPPYRPLAASKRAGRPVILRRKAALLSPSGCDYLAVLRVTNGSPAAMILLIDNYDSFTWNLVHYLGQLGATVEVYRNDQLTVDEVMGKKPKAIVLSPGPCDPDKAGICLSLIERARETTPILGVCLGHQAIGQIYGGKVVRAPAPMHGKVSAVRHTGVGVFKGLPSPFNATRYHSLTVDRSSLPNSLTITAETDDGVIMGVQHREHQVHGVQFHPESIATEHGHALLRNFLELARAA